MKLRLALYSMTLFFFFLTVFAYKNLKVVEGDINRAKDRLRAISIEVRSSKEKLRILKEAVKKEGIEVYTKESALERLFGFIEDLRGKYQVDIKGDVREKDSFWITDLKITLSPPAKTDLEKLVERLLSEKAPVAEVSSLMISNDVGFSVAVLEVSLFMPFLEGGK